MVEEVTNESVCDSLFLSHLCALRDGGLKRAKVKDAFKEEQQKLYSKVLVGEQDEGDQSDNTHLEDGNPGKDNQGNQDSTKGQWGGHSECTVWRYKYRLILYSDILHTGECELSEVELILTVTVIYTRLRKSMFIYVKSMFIYNVCMMWKLWIVTLTLEK